MLELFLILGAAFLGYKLVTSGSGSTSTKRALDAAPTRREVDLRTDAARKAAGAKDLWVEDFAELPFEVRKHVLTALADPTTLPADIRDGAEAFLAGCSDAIEKKSHDAGAVVGGGSIPDSAPPPTKTPPFDTVTKAASPSWCYPVAAARLLKIAATLEADLLEEAAKEEVLGSPTLVTEGHVSLGSPIKRSLLGPVTAVEKLDLKKLIVDKIAQEVSSLPDSEPSRLRTNVRKLVDLILSRPDLTVVGYQIARQRNDPDWAGTDPEWLRLVASSLESTYKISRIPKTVRGFADALEVFETSHTAAEEAYEAEIAYSTLVTDADTDAAREWPQLWAVTDPGLQPVLRDLARAVKKYTTDDSITYGLRTASAVFPTLEEIASLIARLTVLGFGSGFGSGSNQYDQAVKALMGLQRGITEGHLMTVFPGEAGAGITTSGYEDGFGGSASVTL